MINRLKQYEFEKQKNDLVLKGQIKKAIEDGKTRVNDLIESYSDRLKNKCVKKAEMYIDNENDSKSSCDFRDNMEEYRINKVDLDQVVMSHQ